MSNENPSKTSEEREARVESVDTRVLDLESRVATLENLLLKIIEDQEVHSGLLTDIDYVTLQKNLSAEERAEIPFYLIETQKEFKFEGKVPSLDEFHEGLLDVLGIEPEERAGYSIHISRQLIKEHVELDVFPVGDRILGDR